MGRFSVHPGERAIHSELVSILDIAPKVYDVMGVRKEVGDATARGGSLVPRFRSSGRADGKRIAWKFGKAD
jgi:arylsulfatase A-like enzyme